MNGNRITETFQALRSKLKNVATAILHDRDDAEDALQDAFCRLWKKRDDINPDNLESNTRIMLRYVCLDMLRLKSKFASTYGNEIEIDDKPEEPSIWTAPEIQQLTSDLLSKLPDKQRRAFEMMAEGVDNDIIALRLGMSQEAVRQNICRARKTLREEYNKIIRR